MPLSPDSRVRALAADAAPEDLPFIHTFAATLEYEPAHPKFGEYVSFNLQAIERGRKLANRLTAIGALARNVEVLDIGAGSGGLAIALEKAGACVTAIEPDPVRLRWADVRIRGHGASVNLSGGRGECLPFPDARFDLVTLDSVMEHVDSPAQVVREVSRVLRPGGCVYLVWPNKFSVMSVLRDPHYTMFGVVLMPEWLGRLYVERVRGVSRGYWVNTIRSKRWMTRRFAAEGVHLAQLEPGGFEKLDTPGQINYRPARIAATVAQALRLTNALHRVLLAQYPAFVLLGRKAAA